MGATTPQVSRNPTTRKSKSKIKIKEDAQFLAIRIFAFFYAKMLIRGTWDPLKRILHSDHTRSAQVAHFKAWAEAKEKEAKYIQVAGGFLFTSVVTCVSWPGLAAAHWSAVAFFYASIVFALVAIVSGSQQLALLPGMNSPDQDVTAALDRMEGHLGMYVFALQTPLMLLQIAVACFLAGLCGIVFSPLRLGKGWNDDAKIATLFGVAGVLVLLVFYASSELLYRLFPRADVVSHVRARDKYSDQIAAVRRSRDITAVEHV